MSIFDIFRSAPNQGNRNPNDPALANANPNAQPPNNQNQQQNNNPNLNPQNVDPNANQQKPPEDPFKDFWKIDDSKKGPADLADFKFSFDPAKVDQQVGQMDFTKVITPELAQKIAAGGQDAVSATLTAMNLIGQQATKTALLAATKITETGLQSSGQRIKDHLPNLVREHTVSNALREDNPLFNDPATAPVFQAIESQFARQFPNATPQEIRQNAMKYMERFATNAAKFAGKVVSDAPVESSSAQRGIQTDWSKEPT